MHRRCHGHYDIKEGSSGPPTTWPISLVQRSPQAMFLWALLCPGRCAYKESTWTASDWAGHGTQLGLEVEDLISVLLTLFFSFFLSLFSQYLAHCTQYLAPDIEKIALLPSTLHPNSLRILSLSMCISAQKWGTLEEVHSLPVLSLF